MKHYVYKCRVCLIPEHNLYSCLITVYSCSDFYVKYPWQTRAQRVNKAYLAIMFPHWYKDCGLFHMKGGD